ncbi:MAG: pyridoxamine kinase [Lachnospiraceae bacterium]|nr:pyridoxamine kinase [Lachnospiraceae bacterium]
MKKIALINDMSGFGKCSLTAAIPVISVMGMQACPLPTAVLTAQTEFGEYYCDDLTDKMDMFTEMWKKMGVCFDGIYSGFLASVEQLRKLEHFLEVFEAEDTFYLADPVMGDRGMTYDMFSQEFLQGMKKLTSRADVITPNLMELCLLSDVSYEEMITHRQDENYIEKIADLCKGLLEKAAKPQTVVVTGIIRTRDGREYVGNLAVSDKETVHVENPFTGKGFSGTGDLFASVICGSLVKGLSVKEAVEKATYFLQEAIEEATRENIPTVHGVNFEKYLYKLL